MITSDLRTVFVRPSAGVPKFSTADFNEIRKTLETGSDSARISTMKSLVLSLVNGERELVESLLMTLIRFVLPLRNKTLKKLLLYLFENIPKTDSEGNLKQEFILVCNAWRNDLQHPNEYIRGATLRFLCHVREAELLEPLVPSVRQCLDHDHVYVRKNAIYASFSVFKNVDFLMPDAPELIEDLLTKESDVSCQRAAFIMLSQTEPERAINYFNLIADKLPELDGNLQLAVIQFIRLRQGDLFDLEFTQKLNKVLLSLLKRSSSPAAKFEAACTLISFENNEEILKACCDALIQLASKEADNSIKLVALMKLQEKVLPDHPAIIQACVLDLLRVLASPDASVRKVCLQLVSAGTSSRVALEIVLFLKKELVSKSESDSSYRRELLDALHVCSMKFSEVATEVMNAYLDLLKNGYASETLISFIKEALFKYPNLRRGYLSSVISALPSVTDSKAIRNLLWVLGEFCQDEASCLAAVQSIATGLGELPMLAAEERYEAAQKESRTEDDDEASNSAPVKKHPSGPKVLADGTYATESAFSSENSSSTSISGRQLPNIKRLFVEGKFECSGVLANALTKLVIRLRGFKSAQYESIRCRVLLMFTSILRLGASKFVSSPIDGDSAERIALCIQLVLQDGGQEQLERAFTSESEAAFNAVLQQESKHMVRVNRVQIDEAVDFGFSSVTGALKKASIAGDGINESDALNRLLYGSHGKEASAHKSPSLGQDGLNKVVQLTGFSDTLYAETYVQVRDKEIYLDILLVNQTEETLQNVSIDLNCSGDLKLIERPPQLTLPALSFATSKAVLRVTATNHGQIFGCISFLAGATGQEADSVIIGEVKIDVLEYILPASIAESRFREAWVLLEWENKISVRVPGEVCQKWSQSALEKFIQFLATSGHMTPITPNAGLEGNKASFLACNFYAKSIFDEEILANICLEHNGNGGITGHLRLRSKTQGLAIAFGDKLNTLIQQMK